MHSKIKHSKKSVSLIYKSLKKFCRKAVKQMALKLNIKQTKNTAAAFHYRKLYSLFRIYEFDL